MTKRFIPIWLVVLLLVVACGSDKHLLALLDSAETVMTTAPDTALALLDSIDSDRLSRADNARYALLRSQALDKNYIDVTNDSLINIAVKYYQNSQNYRYKGMAYYYLSRVYENCGQYEDAISYSVLAEDILNRTHEYNMIALILDSRGDIYAEQYRLNDAIKLKKQAISYYEKCNNWRNIAYLHLRLSNLSKIEYTTDSAELHLDIAQQIGLNLNNEEILFNVENYRASLYEYIKEYDKAKLILQEALMKYSSHQPNFDDYFLLSRIYYYMGKPDSALYYIDKFIIPLAKTHSDKEVISFFKSEIYKSKADHENAWLIGQNSR